jgi:hypothetical protein
VLLELLQRGCLVRCLAALEGGHQFVRLPELVADLVGRALSLPGLVGLGLLYGLVLLRVALYLSLRGGIEGGLALVQGQRTERLQNQRQLRCDDDLGNGPQHWAPSGAGVDGSGSLNVVFRVHCCVC